MTKTDIIIKHYPFILRVKERVLNTHTNSSSFRAWDLFCSELNKRLNVDISPSTLSSIISKINNKKFRPYYNNIIPLLVPPESKSDIEKFSVKYRGIWFCLKNSDYKKSWVVNENNITWLPDPVGLLYVKRFLHLYHIPDEFLIDSYKKRYSIELTESEQTSIKNIDSSILKEYGKIHQEATHKSLDNLFGEYYGKRV